MAPQVLEYSTDSDEELREHCLQALEAFVLKCPKEVQPHIPTVSINFKAFAYLAYEGMLHATVL